MSSTVLEPDEKCPGGSPAKENGDSEREGGDGVSSESTDSDSSSDDSMVSSVGASDGERGALFAFFD